MLWGASFDLNWPINWMPYFRLSFVKTTTATHCLCLTGHCIYHRLGHIPRVSSSTYLCWLLEQNCIWTGCPSYALLPVQSCEGIMIVLPRSGIFWLCTGTHSSLCIERLVFSRQPLSHLLNWGRYVFVCMCACVVYFFRLGHFLCLKVVFLSNVSVGVVAGWVMRKMLVVIFRRWQLRWLMNSTASRIQLLLVHSLLLPACQQRWQSRCCFSSICLCACVYIHVVASSNSCENVVLRGFGRLRGLISYFFATRSS